MSLLNNKYVILSALIILLMITGLVFPTGAQTEIQESKAKINKISLYHVNEERTIEYKQDIQTLNKALWINKNHEIRFYNKLAAIEEEQRQAEIAKQAAITKEQKAQNSSRQIISNNTPSSGRCGGSLPPCCVMQRESGGSLTAQNPSSTASGKWQFISSTWNNYGGYPTAASAPESVQDAKAAELWANGAGAGHWGGGC